MDKNSGKIECVGIFGKVFGHKYSSRYDVKEFMPPIKVPGGVSGIGVIDFIKALKTNEKSYVCDICERCGDVINERN